MTYRVMSVVALALVGTTACQQHGFVFQPDTDRAGTHLQFTVQTPSKADILFVIDNSGSMVDEQQALKRSIGQMLTLLAPRDTSYRIGITSTSVPMGTYGYSQDCCGNPLPPSPLDGVTEGNRGSCLSCDCVGQPDAGDPTGVAQQCLECATCDPWVKLRRPVAYPPLPPHDGARGRLIAAYDSKVFTPDAKDADGNYLYVDDQGNRLSSDLLQKLASLFPTSPTDGPVGYGGIKGARWVIDRQSIRQDACNVCNCSPCDPNSTDPTVKTCFDTCAKPIAQSLVKAYFDADIDGLGVDGYGHEEGLLAGMLAVGIDPRQSDSNIALNPAFDLTSPGGANTFPTLDSNDQPQMQSWIRDDASLAIMFVSDEQDCSLPTSLMNETDGFEEQAKPVPQPDGSACYQTSVMHQALDVPTMAKLLATKKGSVSKVVIGFIGGVQYGPTRSDGTATDCAQTDVTSDTQQPSTRCAGMTGASSADATGWLQYTTLHDSSLPTCDAMKGTRYVDFADNFPRRTFDSICRNGSDAFGPALQAFTNLITMACFDLKGIRPANDDPTNIEVRRSPRNSNQPLEVLPMLQPNGSVPPGGAWTYVPAENEVCLDGLDRDIGDKYDIFILQTNMIDYSK